MKAFGSIFVLVLLLAPLAPAGPADAPILPQQFAGWQMQGAARLSQDPAVADPVNPALVKEYGFSDFASATFTRDDGRKLTVKAARFADASGAYGAFTYYKLPQMLNEKFGDQGASLNERVLFYKGNVLVDAVFQKLTAMSAAELRELAGTLPLPTGNNRNLPGLPRYLPRESYLKNTAKYVVGPIGLQKISAPLPGELVDFGAGAEVVLGNYRSSGGEGTLMLISYPTPQIAAEHLRKIDESRQSQGSPSVPSFSRRTGPIVVLAAGPFSEGEAESLLGSVNWEADVTWNEATSFSKKDNIGNLVWNALLLCGILMLFALAIGLAFGGLRVLIRRLFPDKVFGRAEGNEFISLHLSEAARKHPESAA